MSDIYPEWFTDEMAQALRAPFSDEDVEWRVQGSVSKNNSVLLLPYGDARACRRRLNEVFGVAPFGWRVSYETVPMGAYTEQVGRETIERDNGHAFLCTIQVGPPFSGFAVSDAASPARVEPAKGGASDAFKRACAVLGVFEYLYDVGDHWARLQKERPNGRSSSVLHQGAYHYAPWPSLTSKGAIAETGHVDHRASSVTWLQSKTGWSAEDCREIVEDIWSSYSNEEDRKKQVMRAARLTSTEEKPSGVARKAEHGPSPKAYSLVSELMTQDQFDWFRKRWTLENGRVSEGMVKRAWGIAISNGWPKEEIALVLTALKCTDEDGGIPTGDKVQERYKKYPRRVFYDGLCDFFEKNPRSVMPEASPDDVPGQGVPFGGPPAGPDDDIPF